MVMEAQPVTEEMQRLQNIRVADKFNKLSGVFFSPALPPLSNSQSVLDSEILRRFRSLRR
jgi:hypothetical protein